jgi:hypothetical protein
MTTEYQTVIDYAEQISINSRKKISQTVSRDGTVKTTSLGGQVWEFEVAMPNGLAWTDFRSLIEKMNYADRNTTTQIQINNAGHSWINQYQGNVSNLTNIVVSFTSGNTVTITNGATGLTTGQYKFKAGDFIQLGTSGSVYTVAADVDYNDITITLNRPVRETAGSYTLKVGPAVTWDVICVSFPKWTMFARDQISWDGPFVFSEAI